MWSSPAHSPARGILAAAVVGLLAFAPVARAANQYWMAPNGGTGSWTTAGTNWSATVGGPASVAFTSGSTANFGNTAGTVTLSNAFTAAGLTFTTTGYTLTGNTLTLNSTGTITVGSGIAATVNSILAGTVGLLETGGGTLTLGGVNTYTGTTAIQNGTLVDALAAGAIPQASNVTLGTGTNSGILQIGAGTTPVNQTLTGTLSTSGTGTANAVVGGASGTSTLTLNNTSNVTLTLMFGGTGTSQNNLALVKSGASTLTLNAPNTYNGGTTANVGSTLIGIAQASGSPFGSGPITANSATVDLKGIAGTTTTTVGNVTFTGGANFIVDNTTGSGSAITTVAAGNAARSGFASLIITPVTGVLGSGENLTFTNGNTLLANNILPPYVVAQASGTSTVGDFVSYNGSGAVTATAAGAYFGGDLTGSGPTNVVNQTSSPSIMGPVAAYALNTSVPINLSGNTLTLGSGTGQAGLILNGGSITNGTISYAGAEATIYANANNTGGIGTGNGAAISANVTGLPALTVFGPGNLAMTGNFTFANSTAFPTNIATVTNLLTGAATLTLGTTGSTITLGNTSNGSTLVLANGGTATNTTIVNGVIQDPAGATAGSTGGTVSLTSSGIIQLNALSTYTGGTTGGISISAGGGTNLGTWPAGFVPGTNISAPGSSNATTFAPIGGVIEIGVSSNGAPGSFTAGPFGVAPVYMNNGTNPIIVPFGADRTIANTINMNSGFIASQVSGNPYNLIFTGQMNWNGSHQLLSNIPSPQALYLNGNINLSTTTSGATNWTLGSQTGSGVIIVNGTVSFPAGVTATGTSITINTGGTFTFNGALTNLSNIVLGGSASGVVSINAPFTSTVATASISDAGAGTLNMNAQSTYAGGTTLTGSGTILGIEVSSNALPGASFTSGPLGTGTLAVSNEHLRPIGGSQSISNAISMTAGLAMDNVPGDTTSSLTIAGPIGTLTTGHFISNGFSTGQPGGTMILGSATSPSTITLPSTANSNPSFGALQGPIVINDVIQQSGSVGGSGGVVAGIILNPQTTGGVSDSYPITINSINTYTGTTTIGGGNGGTMPTNIGPILLGSNQPFGIGGALITNSTLSTATFIPVVADRTVANPITMTTGFAVATATAAQDATGAHNLTLTGPITLAAAATLGNNMASTVALTLGSSGSPSTISAGGTLTIQSTSLSGTTIVNDAISGAGGLTISGGTVVLNTANTYGGTTTLGNGAAGGEIILFNSASAFNTGTIVASDTTGLPVLEPVGANLTLSNPITLTNTLGVGTANATQDPTGPHNLTLSGLLSGPGGVSMTGSGTLFLTNSGNTYTGGTNALNGTIQVAGDSYLGTGNVTGATLGTLSFTSSTATTKSFAMNGGTISIASGQTLTFNGSQISSATLDGGGTFATNAAIVVNSAATSSVAITSNSASDQFVHFVNNAALTFAGGLNPSVSTAISNLNGFTNEGSGAVTIGAGSAINAANFQTYGTLTLLPNTTTAPTVFTNTGKAPLGFNGGSRTFIGTSATADPTGQNIVDYVDLHGQNAIVTDALFVNNGGVYDTVGAGTHTIIADYGSLVKGAGFYQNTVKTQNGGKFQTGNSPGSATFGNFVFGPGGVNNYVFAIDDATGAAGPSPGPSGLVSGWGLIKAVQASIGAMTTSGSFTWTATPADPLTVAIDTLVNPTMSGTDVAGPMANFDPAKPYSWLAAQWTGSYSGPSTSAALDSATGFETNGIVNPIAGTFGWNLDSADNTLSLVYTPGAVPEPGTLALTGLAGLAAGWVARRRRARAANVA